MRTEEFFFIDNRDDNCPFLPIQERKRRNSETDYYQLKISERCKYDYYFKSQNKDKQKEIIDKETEIANYFNTETPLKYKILYSLLPISTKSFILNKIEMFEEMNPHNSEYNKLSKWLNDLSQIPFDTYIKVPISLKDSTTKIQNFLHNALEILEKTIYGQADAKNKIMQILAQWITNPNSMGQIIALEGPPGVGKTCLIKNGVSKALNRPFLFYALGGATDISNLEGHSYTYEGAIYGRIVEMLMQARVMNPVIFFDELDKISDTPKGNEIVSLLTHLTDNIQNNIFSDKYFAGINIDLSKVLFFFSYNDPQLLNPILKDRLTIVKFKRYAPQEKVNIVQNYILPELLKNIGFKEDDITIDNETILYIIENKTEEEAGVRNIRRSMENILMKINLRRLMKEGETISFPHKLTIDKLNYNNYFL